MLTESLASFMMVFHFASSWLNMDVSFGKFLIAKGDFRIGYRYIQFLWCTYHSSIRSCIYLNIFACISTLALIGPTYLDPKMLFTANRLSSILVIKSSLFPRIIYLPSFSGAVTIPTFFQIASTLTIISVNSASFAACTDIFTISVLILSSS